MPVFAIATNIYSPLGNGTTANFEQMLAGHSGIQNHTKPAIHPQPFYASLFGEIICSHGFTKFEQILAHSIQEALAIGKVDITHASTAFILSTTKGNIGLLEKKQLSSEQLTLHYSAQKLANHFGHPNRPMVVSNACISGLSALTIAKRMIEAGLYQTVVVAGADLISAFVFSGFTAFQAISSQPCKPYDASRNGITLGEAAATIILSSVPLHATDVQLAGSGGSNDANHISGPSRTGAELAMAMQKAMKEAALLPTDINFISAHGTATVYNDEMESKAITLAGLQQVPVNSIKGYIGHTLGAAGIIESAVAIESIRTGKILPTKGFTTLGVPMPIAVVSELQQIPISTCLKTASGFGGSNAAIVWKARV